MPGSMPMMMHCGTPGPASACQWQWVTESRHTFWIQTVAELLRAAPGVWDTWMPGDPTNSSYPGPSHV